jgi:hypothetical protein
MKTGSYRLLPLEIATNKVGRENNRLTIKKILLAGKTYK